MDTIDKKKPGRPATTNGKKVEFYLPADVVAWLEGQGAKRSTTLTKLVREQMQPSGRMCSVLECTKPALRGDIFCDFHRGMEVDADEQSRTNAEMAHGK